MVDLFEQEQKTQANEDSASPRGKPKEEQLIHEKAGLPPEHPNKRDEQSNRGAESMVNTLPTDLTEKLVQIAPKIKAPIQLAAFATSLVCGALVYRSDPNNIASIAIIASLLVATLVIPLTFHRELLLAFTKSQRAPFLLILITLLMVSFGAQAYMGYRAYTGLQPDQARFDTEPTPGGLQVIPNGDGSAMVIFTLTFYPLSLRENQGATIFIGLLTAHDEDLVKDEGSGKLTNKSCEEVETCLGYATMKPADGNLLVRSSARPVTKVFRINVKRVPKHMRIWWVFYQAEGPDKTQCAVNNVEASEGDGIPKLALFKSNQYVSGPCYGSINQYTFETENLVAI